MDYHTLRIFADTAGLVLLVILFVGVLWYALRPRNRKKFDHASRIPLQED